MKSNSKSFIYGLDKYINQVNEQGLKGITDYFSMDLELYQYFVKTMVKSVVITKTDIANNTSLNEIIKPVHHNRITRVDVNTLFDSITFYTVHAFSMYSYQCLNGKLIKFDHIKEVCQ